MKQFRNIFIVYLNLFVVMCSSIFQVYDKSNNGLVYEVSTDFKSKNYLSSLNQKSLLNCMKKCHQIKECSLVMINKISKFMNNCEFYSNVPMRVSQIYQTSSTFESQLIYFKKGSEIKTLKYGSNHQGHLTPTHSLRLRQGNQLNVEYLDIYYDWEKITGYIAYFFNGTIISIGTTNTHKLQIDFKNKIINKIKIRTDSTKVIQLQFCWVSQIDFTSLCSSAAGGTAGTSYNFYYDSEFKRFQIEYLIVYNGWWNDNIQFIFREFVL
ncbi:unnamed protein product [Brachionus calyciflorus]|uniref:Uncharacterized protein n=1 Tax=Brachionus calyciflorus TaxID=104777 RepID=A0A813PES6_9BILA|nr:unnamed protein product [Brachionus calyciflorus]